MILVGVPIITPIELDDGDTHLVEELGAAVLAAMSAQSLAGVAKDGSQLRIGARKNPINLHDTNDLYTKVGVSAISGTQGELHFEVPYADVLERENADGLSPQFLEQACEAVNGDLFTTKEG
jgi:hypothetical protein